MTLLVQGDVARSVRDALEAATAGHRTLEEVVRWGLSQDPMRLIEDVVHQDEYTQDVIMPWGEGVYLVYDTT